MACSAQAGIRIVRTGTNYATVQAAATAALDGDTIEIDSGTYVGSQRQRPDHPEQPDPSGRRRDPPDPGRRQHQHPGQGHLADPGHEHHRGVPRVPELPRRATSTAPASARKAPPSPSATATSTTTRTASSPAPAPPATSLIENCEFGLQRLRRRPEPPHLHRQCPHAAPSGTATSTTAGRARRSRAAPRPTTSSTTGSPARDGYSNYEVSLCQGGDDLRHRQRHSPGALTPPTRSSWTTTPTGPSTPTCTCTSSTTPSSTPARTQGIRSSSASVSRAAWSPPRP